MVWWDSNFRTGVDDMSASDPSQQTKGDDIHWMPLAMAFLLAVVVVIVNVIAWFSSWVGLASGADWLLCLFSWGLLLIAALCGIGMPIAAWTELKKKSVGKLIVILFGSGCMLGIAWYERSHYLSTFSTPTQPVVASQSPRVASAPVRRPKEVSAISAAQARVTDFEKKRAALEPLLEKALADRDDLVAKLRAAGIKSAADLKGNAQGQKLAASLQRISAEVEGLERQQAALDSAILEAKAVVRRLEREQVGIGEEEMQKLAEQLREAEERTDGIGSQPLTPFDVDAALEKALAAPPRPTKPATPKTPAAIGSTPLVGTWTEADPLPSMKPRMLTFTKGGSALLTLFGVTGPPATYTLSGSELKITAEGRTESFSLDFVSDREVVIVSGEGGRGGVVAGRWKRSE